MRPDHILLAALLIFSAPAGAQPGDPALAEALRARNEGRHADAIALFERLAAQRPDDTNVLRLLGTSYGAGGRFDEADATLARARALAPQDQDIALAQARIALWSGRIDRAAQIADAIAAAEPDNVELPQLRDSIRAARSGTGRRAGLSFSHGISWVSFTGRDATWHETTVAADIQINSRATLSGEVERVDRGAFTDTRLGVRLDRRFAGGGFYLAATATPDADFRERWSLRAGGELRISPNLVATLDGRRADYGIADITALEPGLRVETGDGRFAFAVRSINLWDEGGDHRSGWSSRGDAALSDGVRLFAGAATYPDTEAGITRRVRSIFGGGALALTPRLSLRVSIEHEERVATYRRTGGTIGLRWRFGR